ncbi:GvpL/GvpF family gas vesicle protein [Amycolatopsis sp. NPDC051758]|uniref:GvpL/GvpF family gas vesicle protein n=1 Tax=Amycolatopsis sp. NPDC051758 TaxID=3363935 RepID=UPI0037941BB4
MTAAEEVDPEVTALARRHAPEVWEAALQAAKSAAAEVLTRRLTDAILTSATGPRSTAAPEPAIPEPDPGLCAYAITWSHAEVPETLAEVDAAPAVRLLPHEDLAVVVARVDVGMFADLDKEAGPPDGLDPGSRLAVLARQHDAVVRAVFEGYPVLPLRFGTVVRDDRAAALLLEEHRADVSEWLSKVDGHREWGVRVALPAPAGKPPLDGISGTDYLTARARQLNGDQQVQTLARSVVSTLHESLSRCSADAAQREQPPAFFDASYLVRQDREETFHDLARRVEDDLAAVGATLRSTGPWPPYSFTPSQLVIGS